MYKLETQFAYFRFNHKYQHGPFNITWYVLEEGSNANEYARCFTHEELNKFQNWINAHPHNFPSNGDKSNKNYYTCTEGEGPECGGILGMTPGPNRNFPSNLIIRNTPQLSANVGLYYCMDIIITTPGNVDNHNYNLDFNVIGEIRL